MTVVRLFWALTVCVIAYLPFAENVLFLSLVTVQLRPTDFSLLVFLDVILTSTTPKMAVQCRGNL